MKQESERSQPSQSRQKVLVLVQGLAEAFATIKARVFKFFYWYMQKIKLSRSSVWAFKESPWARAWSDDAVLQFQVFPELFKAMRPSHWGLVLENPQIVEKKAFPLFDSATYRKKNKETPHHHPELLIMTETKSNRVLV